MGLTPKYTCSISKAAQSWVTLTMIIVECHLDNPILRRPLECVSDIKIVWEQTYQLARDSTQMDIWVQSNDFGRVDEAIDHDPSVQNPDVLPKSPGRKCTVSISPNVDKRPDPCP